MRIRMFGLCLVAVLAVAAAVTATASAALPEYKVCAKTAKVEGKYTGSFSDKNCTKSEAGGKYELVAGTGKKAAFKAKSGLSKLETAGFGATECKSGKAAGEFSGTKELKNLVVEFKNCETLGKKCTSAGQKAGVIKTNTLDGILGYISKSPLKVGVAIKGQTSEFSSEFSCEGPAIRTKGAAIGVLTGNINTISKSFSLTFNQSGGHQEFTNFEGGTAGEEELRTEFNLGEGFMPPGGISSGQQQANEVKGEALEIAA